VTFTTGELIHEVERELKQRRRVYPRLVAANTLSVRLADEQVAKMEAVLAILCERERRERLI
jgi:hypothetical protein